MAISGNTLAVGAQGEESNATGINQDETNNSNPYSGAVYIFTRSEGIWSQQAYLKSSNSELNDFFGSSLALDGNTLVVGASFEDSSSTGINSEQSNNNADGAGAVYVFTRAANSWSQQAYIKASNTGASDQFGNSLDLDGNTLVVGARREDSNSSGVNGDDTNNDAGDSGAAYVFTRSNETWTQQAFLKASNSEAGDLFGYRVAISGDSVAVTATNEASNLSGINPDEANNDGVRTGAVYVFTRSGDSWSQQAYIKASSTNDYDEFGASLSIDGDNLAVGA